MSKSGRVRLTDLHRAHRLIHDCRDVGHDLDAWPILLARGLAPLLGGQVCIVGKIELHGGRFRRNVLLAEHGWESVGQRRLWHDRYVDGLETEKVGTFVRYMEEFSDLTTRSRGQLIDDSTWYRSYEFQEIHRPIAMDDLLVSYAPAEGGRSLVGFAVSRSLGECQFAPRERRLLRLFHAELLRHLGTSIVAAPGGPLADLSPRLRQLLDCLLEGDTQGQAAYRLGLSRHTVHDYVAELYRRLGVRSRAELSAYCFRVRPAKGSRDSFSPTKF